MIKIFLFVVLVMCSCAGSGKKVKYYISGSETCDSVKFDCIDLWNVR